MGIRVIVATALALGLLTSPAAAARLKQLKPCYTSAGAATEEREDVVVAGEGFAEESRVDVLLDGVLVGSPPTGSIGEFSMLVDAPFQPRGERGFTITVRDPTDPATTVTAQSRVTNLTVAIRPKRAAPSRRVRFRGRGFTRRPPVFAHYLYDEQEKRTVRLARRSKRPCGTFSARRRQIPVENVRTGRWIVQVDQKRAYSPVPDPVWVRVPIDVTRVFLEP